MNLDEAADAIISRASELVEAGAGCVEAILVLAQRKNALDYFSRKIYDPRRLRYAKRICAERNEDPDAMVDRAPRAPLSVNGRAYAPWPPDVVPLYTVVYASLPPFDDSEGEEKPHTMGKSHAIDPVDGACRSCGASREEIVDGLFNRYVCPGPCTEPRMIWRGPHYEMWQRQAGILGWTGDRYIRPIPADAESERLFAAWKAGK